MKLWVIKIGTTLLRRIDAKESSNAINIYCEVIANAMKKGNKIILVSSGAVGIGCKSLSFDKRPKDIIELQAVASVGQGTLMAMYKKAMRQYDINVAQILLTQAEFASRSCYKNACETIMKLLDWNILPIINENDSIANDELKYGDNDTLSALVASAVKADELVILTDIDKLYSSDPKYNSQAKPITDVEFRKDGLDIETPKNFGEWGKGGINTKLYAAKIATERGIKVHLADGRTPLTLMNILKGSRGGTVFYPSPNPVNNIKSWLAHALKPTSSIIVDKGAYDAIMNKGASLLLVGITDVEGEFLKNHPIKLATEGNKVFARGLSLYSSQEIKNKIKKKINSEKSIIVVHRDILVLSEI